MAHPCIDCGGDCYCCGDIDDSIVSKTPKKCIGCDCVREREQDMIYDDDNEYWQPCDDCDMPDACEDFGCAIKAGIRPAPGN